MSAYAATIRSLATDNALPASRLQQKFITMGEFFASREPVEIRTTLGSCIAVCVHDPILKIGGMNHFLTPGNAFSDPTAQYGVFAMEFLINELIIMGGVKSRFEVKVFGGGAVLKNISANIGQQNCDFVREYLADEKLSIVASDLGGDYGRQVAFFPHSGNAKMKRMRDKFQVAKAEEQYLETQNVRRDTGGGLPNSPEFF